MYKNTKLSDLVNLRLLEAIKGYENCKLSEESNVLEYLDFCFFGDGVL